MAAGAVLNAMWDLWAKSLEKPLWKLLVDLDPEFVADCIDWRNIGDALTRDEAIAILRQSQSIAPRRETERPKRASRVARQKQSGITQRSIANCQVISGCHCWLVQQC